MRHSPQRARHLSGHHAGGHGGKLNIENMANKSKGEWAYTMLGLPARQMSNGPQE